MSTRTTPPFAPTHQLNWALSGVPSSSAPGLPGYPHIRLDDRRQVQEFLDREFRSEDLDKMADRLWWMSKQDSANISPLHRQLVKGRAIVVSEDPKLHLVWIRDRIFIKPLPQYILSHTFWHSHLAASERGRDDDDDDNSASCIPPHPPLQEKKNCSRIIIIRRAALGYLRTYARLIQYESDFRIARDLHLIPAGITWESFCAFASDLRSYNITDREVSARYAYGEIRLTRLNFYAPFLLRKSWYQRVEHQYASYFARFYGPILFVIGGASVVLSGLQVAVAVYDQSPLLLGVARWASVVLILSFCAVFAYLCGLLLCRIAREWRVAIRDRHQLLRDGHAPPLASDV